MGDFTSHPRSVTSGAIQDNILGPLLWLLYMYDVSKVIRKYVPFLRADGTKIIYNYQPKAVGFTIAKINGYLIPADNCVKEWIIKFVAKKLLFVKGASYPQGALGLGVQPYPLAITFGI